MLLPWCTKMQAIMSVISVHACPGLVVMLWRAALRMVSKVDSVRAPPVVVGAGQPMTRVLSSRLLPLGLKLTSLTP